MAVCSPRPVSPKRVVQFIAPSCYSFCRSCLYRSSDITPWASATQYLARLKCRFLGLFNCIDIFYMVIYLPPPWILIPFSQLSKAAILHFQPPFLIVSTCLDFQAGILNMHRGQLICFLFLRNHSSEYPLSRSSFFFAQ